LFFLFGHGQNGKGVFTETGKRLIGDYGQTAPESLFTKDRNPAATNDVARLAGCRMAIAAELDEGAAFAESRIKALTGGDTITARLLYHEFFDFPPSHKFWISGNHKPTVRGTDHGIWRRLRLVPFTVTIPEGQKDPHLTAKLAEELPGILNWAIAGCLRWQREGLRVPQCVKAATEAYRAEEDIIGQFLDECTEKRPEARAGRTELYQSYKQWAEGAGINYPLTARRFNRQVEERGFQWVKSHGIQTWEGIAISTDD
jgi:putative DNA primase/helicase